ncbi:Uncharacterized iron-regulated membrane protein; Iron-uptake factor PiuB [uncultured Leptolyngbya sp.]|uniref:Uncharacterized iron-regulated membrane protein Iron-uptake factor PiuB n=2 Tax=uncultured Leptolyngbya sp. TaxID=332963 RepID=A0A6J4KFL9_9CYAN|nr:Uncharacterized iron-regulated membrane protein; Iron-uptake factor PiuB [uncultured Leptolyngbya sp.]
MKLRKLTFTLHRYVGVMLGLLLLVIGLSGSSLVFWKEIHHSRNLSLMQVAPQGERVTLDSILEPVRQAYPNWQLTGIFLPRQPTDTYEVRMQANKDQRIDVYVNPYTGELLGSRQWGQTLMSFVYKLHYTLLAGKIGEKIIGTCGLLLLLLCMSGLILWPGWKKLGTGFKIRWRSPARLVNYDVHKVVGLLSVVFLSLTAFSGAGLIFYTEFEGVVYWLTGTPKLPEATSTLVAGKPPIALDAVLQKADAALPGGEITYIRLPQEPDGAFQVAKKLPQEAHPNGGSSVYLDQYSGEILRVDNAQEASLANRILNALFPLHIGAYGGLGMRIFYVFLGLAPVTLSATGFVLWRHRQWDKARRQEAIRQAERQQA